MITASLQRMINDGKYADIVDNLLLLGSNSKQSMECCFARSWMRRYLLI
jgi:hypothetical protein